jgi:TatA/E family protein of Tat protein translocase
MFVMVMVCLSDIIDFSNKIEGIGVFFMGIVEFVILVLIVLLVIGTSKVPQTSKELGKAIRKFKIGIQGKNNSVPLDETAEKKVN